MFCQLLEGQCLFLIAVTTTKKCTASFNVLFEGNGHSCNSWKPLFTL